MIFFAGSEFCTPLRAEPSESRSCSPFVLCSTFSVVSFFLCARFVFFWLPLTWTEGIALWAPALYHHICWYVGGSSFTVSEYNIHVFVVCLLCNNTAVCITPHIYMPYITSRSRNICCIIHAYCVRSGHRWSSTEPVLYLCGTGPNHEQVLM